MYAFISFHKNPEKTVQLNRVSVNWPHDVCNICATTNISVDSYNDTGDAIDVGALNVSSKPTANGEIQCSEQILDVCQI